MALKEKLLCMHRCNTYVTFWNVSLTKSSITAVVTASIRKILHCRNKILVGASLNNKHVLNVWFSDTTSKIGGGTN